MATFAASIRVLRLHV